MNAAAPTNRYFILRHGHSQANEMGLIVSDPQRGPNAFGLTDKGREQVHATVTDARDRGRLDSDTIVICSPFLRAVQTAEIVVDVLGIEGFTRDERLRERFFGTFELTQDSNYQQVWDQDKTDPSHTQWNVEAVTAEVARVQSLLTECNTRYRRQTILFVTHGDIASLLLCWAAGHDLRQHRNVGTIETAEFREVHWKGV